MTSRSCQREPSPCRAYLPGHANPVIATPSHFMEFAICLSSHNDVGLVTTARPSIARASSAAIPRPGYLGLYLLRAVGLVVGTAEPSWRISDITQEEYFRNLGSNGGCVYLATYELATRSNVHSRDSTIYSELCGGVLGPWCGCCRMSDCRGSIAEFECDGALGWPR